MKYSDNLINIIVPRHISRISNILSICKQNKLNVQIIKNENEINKNSEIILVNSFGELPKYYHYCKSVFIGKSLLKNLILVGGQNPIEAAVNGCKIYHGPYVYNFAEIYKYLNEINVTKKVNNIVVSFGGYDKRNLTKFFLNSLLHKNFLLERSLNIELLVGDAHYKVVNTWKKLIKSILTNHKIKINLVVFSSDYFKRLAKADLAVVSGGLTVFDSVSRGVPVIGLPQYKHQLKTLINLESKRVIKLGSLGMRLDKENFINLFNKMIITFEDRIFLSKNSIKLFDRKGSDRVLNILSSLF